MCDQLKWHHLVLKETGEWYEHDGYNHIVLLQDYMDEPRDWEVLPCRGDRPMGKDFSISVHGQFRKNYLLRNGSGG